MWRCSHSRASLPTQMNFGELLHGMQAGGIPGLPSTAPLSLTMQTWQRKLPRRDSSWAETGLHRLFLQGNLQTAPQAEFPLTLNHAGKTLSPKSVNTSAEI